MDAINGALSPPEHLTGTLTSIGGLSGTISAEGGISGTVSIPERIPVDAYEGSYTITPSAEVQTIPVAQLLMRQDFTVEAIPDNYGLVTWNGAFLTIS